METHPPEIEHLLRAIRIVGSQTRLGELLRPPTSPNAVHNWIKRRQVPSSRVIDIERITRRDVTRSQLRPDLYPPRKRKNGK